LVAGTGQDNQCVQVLDLDSGAMVRVGPGSYDGAPVWSPDGARLAFETRSPEGLGICIVDADGAQPQLLTHSHKWNRAPRWAPDGRSLAYAADDGGGVFESRVVVYDLESGAEAPWPAEGAISLLRPVWLPNLRLLYALRAGQEITWGASSAVPLKGLEWLRDGPALVGLGVVKETKGYTTDLFVITNGAAASFPEWTLPSPGKYAEWAVEPSPDGTALAFESNDGGDREIFVLGRKGCYDVSNHRAADWNPVWAPDSAWLAFESFRDGRRGIYRVYAKTARVSPVAVTPGADNWSPAWAPSGKWLAFVSNRTGNAEVYVTDAAGRTVLQVSSGPGYKYAPAWRPRRGE